MREYWNIAWIKQACHGQGTVREIPVFLRVREKSGNFFASQWIFQSVIKVREFRLWSLSMHIFHHLVNDIWTRIKSWIIFLFNNHSPKDFFLNFICFHVLHNIWHKISTIFMKTFSCADLPARPLCWIIYWWIMCFLCGFLYIAKNHHRVYIATMTGICVDSQGKVRDFFYGNPVMTCWYFFMKTTELW